MSCKGSSSKVRARTSSVPTSSSAQWALTSNSRPARETGRARRHELVAVDVAIAAAGVGPHPFDTKRAHAEELRSCRCLALFGGIAATLPGHELAPHREQ